MEYNTTREQMLIPEYGRNVQNMIRQLADIEDREQRTNSAKAIINIMAQMQPGVKEAADYKHKLWDHMYIISGFTLDVDSPYPPPPPLTDVAKPEMIAYPDQNFEYRHYGKIIPKLIDKAIGYEDGPEKDAFVTSIANQMKKSYLNWNRESVTDELIEYQLDILSKGRLKLHQDAKLTHTDDILGAQPQRTKRFKPYRQNQGGKFNQKNRNKPQ